MNLALISVIFLSIFNPSPAMAYLDPGSGSYIIQVSIGLIAGAIFMLKNYWFVIKGFAAKLFNKKQD